MGIAWKWLKLCLGLSFLQLCNGFPVNLEESVADQHTQLLTGLVAVLLTVCSVVLLAGCLCCQRRNGFKEFRDSPVVASAASNLDHGHVNPIANGEFTIFTPLSSSPYNNHVFLANERIITRTAEDFVHEDFNVSSWFAGSEKDFPRTKLKYIKELGKGWFGKVVEGAAKEVPPNVEAWTPVVVRILDATASRKERVLFLSDAAIYRCGTHDNILTLIGRCLDTVPLLLLQEFCPRGDLKNYLRSKKENVDQLLSTDYPLLWCCQLTSALKHLHSNRVTHPDLATRNCQLASDLTLKVGDYGLAQSRYPEDYYQGSPRVPVRWCSPESLICTLTTIQPKKHTMESNVWSLGVTIWEICECGAQPYSALTDDEVVSQVLGPPNTRLPRPKVSVLYTDYLYRLMLLCWTNAESRPQVSQLDLMLSDLWQVYKNTKTSNLDDFDKRWDSFKPNSVLQSDNVEMDTQIAKPLSPSLNNLHGSLDNLLTGRESWLKTDTKNGSNSNVITSIDDPLVSELSNSDSSDGSSPRQKKSKLKSKIDFDLSTKFRDKQTYNYSDSALFSQRTSSESETEDENWRKKVERGAYTEKVRLKSRSVADLMILTHVDYSESESETPLPSLDYRVNYKNVRYAPKNNLDISLTYGSEGNLLSVHDTFQEELKKLKEDRRDSLLFVPDNHSQTSFSKLDNNFALEEVTLSDSNLNNKRLMRELNRVAEIQPPNQVFNVFSVTIDNKFKPVPVNTCKLKDIIDFSDAELRYESKDISESNTETYLQNENAASSNNNIPSSQMQVQQNGDECNTCQYFQLGNKLVDANDVNPVFFDDAVINGLETEISTSSYKDEAEVVSFSQCEALINEEPCRSKDLNLTDESQVSLETDDSIRIECTDVEQEITSLEVFEVPKLSDIVQQSLLQMPNYEAAEEQENEKEVPVSESLGHLQELIISANLSKEDVNFSKSEKQFATNECVDNKNPFQEDGETEDLVKVPKLIEIIQDRIERMEVPAKPNVKLVFQAKNQVPKLSDIANPAIISSTALNLLNHSAELQAPTKSEVMEIEEIEASSNENNAVNCDVQTVDLNDSRPQILKEQGSFQELNKEPILVSSPTNPDEIRNVYTVPKLSQIILQLGTRELDEQQSKNEGNGNGNVTFDLTNQQEQVRPHAVANSIFTSTPASKKTRSCSPKDAYAALNLFEVEKDDGDLDFYTDMCPLDDGKELNYSLETWDNFLDKTLDAQSDNMFDSFTSEPHNGVPLAENGAKDQCTEGGNVVNKTFDVDGIKDGTFIVNGNKNATFTLNQTDSTESDAEDTVDNCAWESGGGWFLHPQTSNKEPSGMIEVRENTDSYVGFGIDDEIMAAIRNELLTKLPHAQVASSEKVMEPEEWDSSDKNEVFLKYNIYNPPLSPIMEESYIEDSDIVTPKQESDNEDSEWSEPLPEPLPLELESHTCDSQAKGPLHRHTPSQDSCCSNDTLFNLEELTCAAGDADREGELLKDAAGQEVDNEGASKEAPSTKDGKVEGVDLNRTFVKASTDVLEEGHPKIDTNSSCVNEFIHEEIKHSSEQLVSGSETNSTEENPIVFTKAQVAPLPSPEDNPWKQLPASLLSYDTVISQSNILLLPVPQVPEVDSPKDLIESESENVTGVDEESEDSGTKDTSLDYENVPVKSAEYENVAEPVYENAKDVQPVYENINETQPLYQNFGNDDIYNEADYVNLVNLENKKNNTEYVNDKNDYMEGEDKASHDDDDIYGMLTDIKFNGPTENQLISASFSESNDINDEQDWDSGSDTRSSSSGEFIWKEGEHEESLKALRAAPQDVVENVKPMAGITEESTDESEMSSGTSDEEGEVPEFVPSAWDKFATPSKSALRSPEKSMEKSEKNKSKGVWFKKQKYHCVYEYPREPESPILQSQDLWKPQLDYSSFTDWEFDADAYFPSTADDNDLISSAYNYQPKSLSSRNLYQLTSISDFATGTSLEDEFFVSSSARPFDNVTSQFFPGSAHWNGENATPDSGVEDGSTPGSSTEIVDTKNIITVPCLKKLASDAVQRTKTNTKSSDALGGLRHTRNKLKLDLPPSPSAFTSTKMFTVESALEPVIREKPAFTTFGKSRFSVQQVDTPPEESENRNVSFEALPYKPLREEVVESNSPEEHRFDCGKEHSEFVRGEASLLDSADEDSGIESSTLERKLSSVGLAQ